MVESRAAILDRAQNMSSVPSVPSLLRKSYIGLRNIMAPRPYPSIQDQARDMLPFSVNSTLNSGADLRKQHIAAVNNHGLVDTAMYLALQVLDGSQEQPGYLEAYVDEALRANNPDRLREITGERIARFPEGTKITFVKAKKIKQINGVGFETWSSQFGTLARKAYMESRTATPVVLAYAGLMGLRPLLAEYRDKEIDIITLKDPQQIKPTDTNVGYRIRTSLDAEVKVEPLSKDFERPTAYYLIDDTVKSGRHLRRVEAVMQGGTETEMTPSHFYVVQVNTLKAA